MPTPDHPDELARRLKAGVEALRAGRPADAVAELERVCDDPDLRDAVDLRDVRARALSLLAQALLGCGRPQEGLARAEAALRLAHLLHDTEGVEEITTLRATLSEAAAKLPAAPGPSPVATERERLLQEADAELASGRAAEALARAERAHALARDAGDPRVEVLARLLIARARPERAPAELEAARSCADEHDEPTLVGAVARTARLLGVTLAPLRTGGS